MANVDNSCSDLKIEDLYSQSKDTLGDILNLQGDTQKNVYGYNFEGMSLRDLMYFWHTNNHSLIDEIHEATDALVNDRSKILPATDFSPDKFVLSGR